MHGRDSGRGQLNNSRVADPDAGEVCVRTSSSSSSSSRPQRSLERDSLQETATMHMCTDPHTLSAVSCAYPQVYGPRGKEPTRYGDWEIKGRATDFS
jgi:hypothetical protein